MRVRVSHAIALGVVLSWFGGCRGPEVRYPPSANVETHGDVPRAWREGQPLKLVLHCMGGSLHENDHVEVKRVESPDGKHVLEIDAYERLRPSVHMDAEGRDIQTGLLLGECEACWDVPVEIPALKAGSYELRFNGRIEDRRLMVHEEDERLRALDEMKGRLSRGEGVATSARAFAANCAPVRGAILAVADDGKLMLLAGGTNGPDGVPVALAEPTSPAAILVGGVGLKDALAGGCSDLVGGVPAQALGTTAAEHVTRDWWGQDVKVSCFPMAWSDETPAASALSGTDLREWSRALRALVKTGARAPETTRRLLAADFARHHRPSSGVVALFADDPHDRHAGLLLVIGACGTKENPHGLSVEVVGWPADLTVVVAGDAAPGGQPGRARGPAEAVLIDGGVGE